MHDRIGVGRLGDEDTLVGEIQGLAERGGAEEARGEVRVLVVLRVVVFFVVVSVGTREGGD
jgi:hypothetical protein